ncbi:efflux RND transporter permease subunit [Synoicihabitans lomoniglobus]|uniref:Efflux RND transporter permease subunit n=1 Tax=Synoicihabitans lomoniglobus TaxID=2909285 RepID=A0AAE9ZQN7_9BACT|nr:efflux RND transporter permease subunit [Opitutaceae bacterium LMO-M01]WED63315.1 efflux RND transporter permease subunit [Opitutaceae bacterium LMO-M01]
MPLTETSVKRPVATAMVFLIIITLGISGLRHLPIDLLPPIEFPQLTVAIDYPGVGPQEIEEIITREVENAVSGVPGVEQVRSRSEEGESRVTLDFTRGTNLDEAANDLRAALEPIRDDLPPDIEPPRVWKFNPNDFPVVIVGVTSSTWDLQELTLILDREITKRFEQLPGVGRVDVWGGVERQVRVDLKRDRLNASQLSSADVRAALTAGNVNLPGGNVVSGVQQLYVRTLGEYTDLEQVRSTVVSRRDGKPIRVGDVADVSFGYADFERLVMIDGKPMLRIPVRKQNGANTVAVSAAVRAEVDRINTERPDLHMLIATDQSTFIEGSISNVANSAGWGALFAVGILYAFLRRGSSTFIIAAAIPISIIATFGLLYFNGLTLNQMSFGGLALGIGLVVDNAVVVLENITRLREEGKDRQTAALIGTKEVAGAIVASTLTTTVIFLPVVFMRTVTGVIFQQLALVVVFALFCSLLVGLTLVPMLASKLLDRSGKAARAKQSAAAKSAAPSGFSAVEHRYARVLGWAIHHKPRVIGGSLLAVAIAALAFPLIPVELAPQTEADEIDVDIRMADGTNIAVLRRYLAELEAIVAVNVPAEAIRHFSQEIRDGRAEVEIAMAPDSPISAADLADQLRAATDGRIPGADIRVDAQSGLWILRMIFRGSGGNEDVSLQLRGYDLDQAQRVGREIQKAIETLSGIEGVRVGREEGRPEQNLIFNREKLAELGLNIREVASILQTNVGGSRAGAYRIGGDEFPILVRLRAQDRQSVQSLDNIPVRLPSGETIPLSAVVDKEASRGPPEIDRINGQRITYVTANLAKGVALGDAVDRIRARLSDVTIPPGLSLYFGGAYEEQAKSAADFRLSIMIAILLIYMVMAAQFERFLDPMVVLCSVPLALIGVVPTLLITGTTINMQSLMGLIMLTGIVVNNAIVLVDYINLLRRDEGLAMADAVQKAGARRLRPILMTTMTTVLGLLPLAIGWGTGAEIQASLARVVLGGLVASTLVTLIFIPVLYVGSHDLLARWKARKSDQSSALSGRPAPATGR